MPRSAPILTRTNRVAIHETFGKQNRAAPTDVVEDRLMAPAAAKGDLEARR
jgi:hypothetical protein